MATPRISPKVKASTTAGAVTPFVLWLLAEYVFHADVPDPVAGLVIFVVPALVTFAAGYLRVDDRSPVTQQQDGADL